MIVMPAVDLRGGACVQLVGGSFDHEVVRLTDPMAAARRWRDAGFSHLHVVDLDGAVNGVSPNGDVVRCLLGERGADTQVGGGIRDTATIDDLLARGASRVITGTRALEDSGWLASVADARPWRVVAAVDVRGGRPAVHGWARAADVTLDAALGAVSELPLAGVLVTSVDVEGRMAGPDWGLVDRVQRRTTLPLIASGGITSMEDLRELRARGVWAAVVGMALYTGALDARATAEEFR
jgi:phosphoribosylformimino-5-aminoimidazole carboxamide ribotide isomerase